jgi:hypothetical protein
MPVLSEILSNASLGITARVGDVVTLKKALPPLFFDLWYQHMLVDVARVVHVKFGNCFVRS